MKHLKDVIQINNDPGKNEIFVIIKPGFLQLSKEIMKMIQLLPMDQLLVE